MNSQMFSIVGVPLSNSRRYSSNSSGFSLIYFSSLKKNISVSGYISSLDWISSNIWEWRIVDTAYIMDLTFGALRVELIYILLVVFALRSTYSISYDLFKYFYRYTHTSIIYNNISSQYLTTRIPVCHESININQFMITI